MFSILHCFGGLHNIWDGLAESSYRTGKINLTPAHIGAVAKAGDTMTGNLSIKRADSSNPSIAIYNSSGDAMLSLYASSEGGNILLVSPNGVRYEFDAFADDYLRLTAIKNGTTTIPIRVSASGALTVLDPATTRTNLGITAANIITPARYSATGRFVKSYSGTGTAVGYGRAVVDIIGKCATINFYSQIVTAGSVSSIYDVGISVSALRSLNSSIPSMTVSNGGIIHYYTSAGALNTNLEGYGGLGNGNTTNNYWQFSRVYDTNGNIGSWPDSSYTSGIRITGVLYGTLS